jgi:hypothetical protein
MRRSGRHIIIVAALLAACFFGLAAAFSTASAQDVPVHPANLSLFYPIGTNQDPTILTYFRLNLMYGRVGYIKGVDIGTIVNRTDRDMKGIQLTGVYSQTGNDLRGAALTGGITYVGGSARGVQVSGLVNFNRSWFRGIQYATFFNFVQEEVIGVQLASLFNLSNGDTRYVQFASFANMAGGNFKGLQLAGGVNYVNERLHGFQAALTNFAVEFEGAQIGALNFAGEGHGAMIGIINHSRELDGVPVGAINWDKTNGNADWSIYGTNMALINTGLRTTVRRWVATAAVGTYDLEEDRDDTMFLSWYYGYMIPLGDAEKWWITPELGYVHVMPQSSKEGKINDLHFMLQALVRAEVRVGGIARVFAGAGVSVRFSEYSSQASTKTDPLFLAGVALW